VKIFTLFEELHSKNYSKFYIKMKVWTVIDLKVLMLLIWTINLMA